MRTKTKRISFRCDEHTYDFLKTISDSGHGDLSDVVRRIIQFFWLGYQLGQFDETFDNMKKTFLEKIEEEREEGLPNSVTPHKI